MKNLNIHLDLCITEEAQRNKDECDRFAAIIKRHVNEYVNCGGNTSNVYELKDAIMSREGLNNVKCGIIELKKSASKILNVTKIPNVSTIHSIKFDENGELKIWQFFEMGNGKKVKLNPKFHFESNGKLIGKYDGEKRHTVAQNPIVNPISAEESSSDVYSANAQLETSWDELRQYIVSSVTTDVLIAEGTLVAGSTEKLEMFDNNFPSGCALKKRAYSRITPG